MAARSRRVSDEEIVRAAWETVFERGPSLTLAEVGAKVGLSAATVVQQFGSKRNLMLGVARIWTEWAATPLEGEGGPIELLMNSYEQVGGESLGPQHIANAIARMNVDLEDPEFREIVVRGFRVQREMIKATLDDAVRAGEIKECDTARLAQHLQVSCQGGLATWAVEPNGTLLEWMAECLESTLAPWRPDAVAA